MIRSLLIAVVCMLATYAGTGLTLRVARHRGIVDVPNARSSHSRVTPRGGGLAILAVFATVLLVLVASDPDARRIWAALLGGIAIGAVGWADDVRGISASARLAVHGAVAAWALWWIGGMPLIQLGNADYTVGWAGQLFGWLFIVWLTNLYNFMDGIDGLAGGHAVVAAIGFAVLLAAAGDQRLALACLALAGTAAGFLVWNWPPASIFMGDVGSSFLGFCFGVLTIAAQNRGSLSILVPTLLLAVFLVDATATLLRRIFGRERWFEAHRSHAYQRAVQRGSSHLTVTAAVLAIDAALVGVASIVRSRPTVSVALWTGTMVALLGTWFRLARPTTDRPPEVT